MANLIKNSFIGGIIDEALSARIDLPKYNQSCRVLKNFILQPQGGIHRRSGLKFIAQPDLDGTPTGAAVQPTLIPLSYNSETSYIIALLELNFKVYQDGVFLDEGDTNFTEEQNKVADYAQSADTLYLVNKEAAPFKIIRTSTANFEYLSLVFGASLATPTGLTGTIFGGAGTAPIYYAITAVSDSGKESLPVFYTLVNGKSPLEWATKNWVTLTWTNPSANLPDIALYSLAVYETTPRLITAGNGIKGYYSADGSSWTVIPNMQIPNGNIRSLAVNPNIPRWVAGGSLNQGSWSDDNGINWTAFNFTFGSISGTCNDIGVSISSNWWVAISTTAASYNTISRSSDGKTWSARTSPVLSLGCIGVNETGPRFLCAARDGLTIYSDNNGDSWNSGGNTGLTLPFKIIYFSALSRWLVVGAFGQFSYSDNNGISWTFTDALIQAIGSVEMRAMAVNESAQRVIVGGAGGKMAYSDDGGETWEKIDSTVFGTATIYDIVYSTALGKYVGVSFSGVIATSSEGIIWSKVEVPDSYNIYKLNKGIYGYIGNARGVYTFTDYNYDPVISDSIPEDYNPFIAENPGSVTLFQQRLWFANTASKSQTIFASRVADFENFNYSPFIRADDSIENTIYSGIPDGIQWMMAFNKTIKVGTVEKAWNLQSASGGAITPTDIAIDPVVEWGAAKVKPVLTGNSLVYVENKGSKLFDIFERQEYLGITGNNLSVNVPNLFEGYSIVSMAYQRTPDPIIWCVRSDGKVVALSYLKNEDLWGWHTHETDGLFKNVTVIPGSIYDEVYFTVYRNSKYVIEKIDDKWTGDLEDARFLDSYVYKENVTPFTVVTGLGHLEGKTVYAVSDGALVGTSYVVSSGQITLSSSVTSVYVGLPYQSVLSPVSSEFATQQGASLGKTKTIGRMTLRLKESRSGKIGPRLDDLDKLETYDYKNLPAGETYTGDVAVSTPHKYSTDGSFYVVQDDPLPMTISAIFLEINMGNK